MKPLRTTARKAKGEMRLVSVAVEGEILRLEIAGQIAAIMAKKKVTRSTCPPHG